ncbi:hypothetical protein COD68_00160 [Bacillus cereus]|nr:hypothetical protein CN414_20645 [Bacillus cereus]PGU88400.1 hypothetical protein COD68_00160 [Bacillus cereus]
MRHTRNRQMTKIGEENFMGMKSIKISTIRNFDGKFPNRLDPTFKWHRKHNKVSYVNFIRWYVKIK